MKCVSSTYPALLQERAGSRCRCLTCERRCLLKPGDVGWCHTRRNDDGVIVTLIYGIISSLSANPIEKKPLYHFYPGTTALTAGSWSCNFDCPWCQNYHISKSRPAGGRSMPAEEFVSTAIEWGCQGTSISLNEPTLSLEWSLDVFRLARKQGLYNTFVTNGYMTQQALTLLIEAGLDAANVDIKGSAAAVQAHCGTDVEVVWRNGRHMRELGVWLEVTTLIIPTVNDDEVSLRGIARRLAQEWGADVPWHVNAYHPTYRFTAPATSRRTLEWAQQIGQEEGLRYVYIGNVPGHVGQHTRCPRCGRLLIQRTGLSVRLNRLEKGHCPQCQQEIVGVW